MISVSMFTTYCNLYYNTFLYWKELIRM